MKKTVIAVAFVASFNTFAFGGNVDPGRIEIGGTASLSASTDTNSGSQFSLNPFAMFYVAPGFALGGSVGLSAHKNGDYSNSDISIGPRVAYYFDIGNSVLYPFIAGGITFDHFSSKNSSEDSFAIPLEGGVRFFLNNFVALDAGLSLNLRDKVTALAVQAGFSMFLR